MDKLCWTGKSTVLKLVKVYIAKFARLDSARLWCNRSKIKVHIQRDIDY